MAKYFLIGSICFFSFNTFAGQNKKIQSETKFKIVAGYSHACLLREGSVTCWGNNASGQLGVGNQIGISFTPVIIPELTSNVIDIASGIAHTCALKKSGTVLCWGLNRTGEVGIGTKGKIVNGEYISNSVYTPAFVQLPEPVKVIYAGGYQSCAVAQNNSVYCWGGLRIKSGRNDPLSEDDSRTTPTFLLKAADKNTISIALGLGHMCINDSGRVSCMGHNLYGAMGDNEKYHPHTEKTLAKRMMELTKKKNPTALQKGAIERFEARIIKRVRESLSFQPNHVEGKNRVTKFASSLFGMCSVSGINNGLSCWGVRLFPGKAKYPDVRGFSNRSYDVSPTAIRFKDGRRFDQIIDLDMFFHGCAIRKDGSVWCFGQNNSGELGFSASDDRLRKFSPTKVEGLPGPSIDIATGGGFSCAIIDREHVPVYCWGANHSGTLGHGKSISQSSKPLEVKGPW